MNLIKLQQTNPAYCDVLILIFNCFSFFNYISVDAKLSAGRLKDDVLARITVAMPKPRDSTIRLPTIPASVSAVKMVVENGERVTEKTLMLNNGYDSKSFLLPVTSCRQHDLCYSKAYH
jgi:hypothetical protein